MKKLYKLLVILIFLCCCSILFACGSSNSSQNNANHGNEASDCPADYLRIYDYNSYEEIKCAFSLLTKENITLKKEQDVFGETYKKFLSYYTGKKFMIFPNIDGKQLPFRNKEGYQNISLLPKEHAGMPWVWYYVTYDHELIIVNMLYTSFLKNQKLTSNMTALEMIDEIQPDEVIGPDNYINYPQRYKSVYEKEITLSDRTVMALVYEFVNDDGIWVSFVYDGTFVRMRAVPDVLTDDFFTRLSFKSYKKS